MDEISSLTNRQLRQRLIEHGITPGPILATTRQVYENQLKQLIKQKSIRPVRRVAKKVDVVSPATAVPTRNTGSVLNVPYDSLSSSEESAYEGEESFRIIPDSDTESERINVQRRRNLKPISAYQSTPYPRASDYSIFSTPGLRNQQAFDGKIPQHYVSGSYVSPSKPPVSSVRVFIKALLFLVVLIFVYMLVLRLSEMDVGDNVMEEKEATE